MKTIKARIAVAVAPSGEWNAVGGSWVKDDDAMSYAVETLAEGESRYWVEVEVALPTSAEAIQATATKATKDDD